ncbi:MAG: glycosyl hydrolase family 9, partial [Pedosphaera sp.]|nr:glycosyl hydrolase family 9 [Pedosphaera sp.]
GEYKLVVPGLGASYPFLINEGVAGTFARTYELGIYHQRCGTDNVLPYSRFTHSACHTSLVEVPTMSSPEAAFVNSVLNNESMGALDNPRHTAPRMTNIAASLYPFVNAGPIDVTGGHHDAGDYSRYTINVAALVHYLVFAVDAFPGVKDLDNLGIPESGDGISDVMQEAKREADYLAKLQDADGGFYFIVYPRTRQYESNVLPDRGDTQLVLPKNTSGTAAAVAALAEIASSPAFKAAYPAEAAQYMAKATAGWNFLQQAITQYGRDGSYQMVTHYGDNFMHDDELAWAAAAMFAATGDSVYDNDLRTHTPNPNDPNLRRWNWWSMFEGYGCAYRTYAFAARTGRLQASQLNAAYLAKCENEIKNAGTNTLIWSKDNAYGSSFSDENKGIRTAGWYFSGEETFDLAVAYLIDPKPTYMDAVLKNFNYEMGCNPVNMSYLTGVGWRQQREVVHQYAQNDYRVLPPSGIPQGNIQQGSYWVDQYKSELGALSFPQDSANSAPYPMYDRWSDAFNVMTEFVVSRQSGKMVATASWLMAMTSLKTQAWNSASARITGVPAQSPANQPITARLSVPGLNLSNARIVWESLGQDPYAGDNFTFTPGNIGNNWMEVEAQLPDGRRVVAATNFFATLTGIVSPPLETNSEMVALYRLNTDLSDATHRQANITTEGHAALDPVGLHLQAIGDDVTITIPTTDINDPNKTLGISVEAKVYINSFNTVGVGSAPMLVLGKAWNIQLALQQDKWKSQPEIMGGSQILVNATTTANALSLRQWHLVNITLDKTNYTVKVDGNQISKTNSTDLATWTGSGRAMLQAGNFDGWIQDLVVRNIQTSNQVVVIPPSTNTPPTTNSPPATNPPPATVSNPVITFLPNDPDGARHFRVHSDTNFPFVIEASLDMTEWTPIYVHYFGGTIDYTDEASLTYPNRSYRARNLNPRPSYIALPPDANGYSQVYIEASEFVPYVIQSASNGVNWTSVSTNLDGGLTVWSDPDSLASSSHVYRVLTPELRPSLTPPEIDRYGFGWQTMFIRSPFISSPYIIQNSTNLLDWNYVYTNSNGGPDGYIDNFAPDYPSRFYRIMIQTEGIHGYK